MATRKSNGQWTKVSNSNWSANNNGSQAGNNRRPRKMKRGSDGQMYPARSGCGMKASYVIKSGKSAGTVVQMPVLYGWNKSSDGYAKFVASPHEDYKVYSKQNKHEWWKYCVKVTLGYTEQLTTGFYNPSNGRLHMPYLRGGMIANPKADYWGRLVKPKN
jgi:hypothetical protein